MQRGQRDGRAFDNCTLGRGGLQEEVTRGNEKAKEETQSVLQAWEEGHCGRWDEVGRGTSVQPFQGPLECQAHPCTVELDGKF